MSAFRHFCVLPLLAGSTRTTCCHKAAFGGDCQRGERQLIGTDGNSPSRPQADGQGGDPISIVGTYAEPVEWPVFGKQVDDYNASTRPRAVRHQFRLAVIQRSAPLRNLPVGQCRRWRLETNWSEMGRSTVVDRELPGTSDQFHGKFFLGKVRDARFVFRDQKTN